MTMNAHSDRADFNRIFQSRLLPQFQRESAKHFIMKMSFYCIANKTHFRFKGLAPDLALNARYFESFSFCREVFLFAARFFFLP